jgi:iron complex transport system permease protein
MTEPIAESLTALNGRRLLRDCLLLLAATMAVAVACSMVGVAELTANVWRMRLVRLATAGLVGSALAAAGMALQALLRNPLAEPYILGVSSGAGVGVLVGSVLVARGLLRAGWASTPALALIGAVASCAVVYGIAQRRGRLDPYVLLLSGVIINVFNGALMLAILLLSRSADIINFVGWGMGQVSDATDSSLLGLCTACVLTGWAVLFVRGAWFNAMGLGDDVAGSVGVPVHWLRVETFALAALMTAAAVALAGPVGFVGLIVPHVCRIIVGADHRRLVLFSGFVGAMFLMAADTLCRTAGEWVSVGSLPVGIVTALTGGPFFIHLLRGRLKETAV